MTALALSACGGTPSMQTNAGAATASATTGPSVQETPVSPDAIADRHITPQGVVPLPGAPSAVLATSDAIWVLHDGGISRIDPKTNRLTKTIRVPSSVGASWAAFAYGSLWVTDFNAEFLLRLDPSTGRTEAKISMPTPEGIVATDGAVWVANHRAGTLSRVDPATNRITAKVVVGIEGPSGPQAMALIHQRIWVGVPNTSSLVEVDPSNAKLDHTLSSIPKPCGDIGSAGGELWVSNCGALRSVDEVDLTAGVLKQQLYLGGFVLGVPIPETDGVWLPISPDDPSQPQKSPGRLLKINASSGQPVDAIGLAVGQEPEQAVAAFGSEWIGCTNNTLLRVSTDDLR